MKLTPGHDFNDFEVASRHSLPVKSILDDEGNIIQCGNPSFDGMPRFKARDEIISALQNMGLYRYYIKLCRVDLMSIEMM